MSRLLKHINFMKTIKQILPAQKINMGGHILDQPLPAQGAESVDPFLLIHHWESTLPGGQKENEVGVGPHPHRGFSPVTFIFKGSITHRDSLGNEAVVIDGGTQWMFAGRGVTHSERFGKKLPAEGGDLEFIQFWVNAPRKNKLDAPFYKPISQEETPLVEEEKSKVWVVSGSYKNIKGVAPTYSPQLLLRGEIETDSELNIPVPKNYNTILYLLDGALEVDGKKLVRKDMAIFNLDADAIEIKAQEKTRFIILAGEPIGEPVASHGPFVMTNQSEIMEAMRDAEMGKMGVLIEEFN